LKALYFGIRAQIADQNYLVDASRHDVPHLFENGYYEML
jgi:hypothetical protein